MNKSLAIIIPAFDEEESIGDLLKELDDSFNAFKNISVLVVDDGSSIRLSNVLNENDYSFPLKIIRNQFNLGQSKSIEIGLKNSSSDLIGLIDADGQNPPDELKKLYEYHLNNEFDGIVSYRMKRKDGLSRVLASKFANYLLYFFTKSRFKDLGSSLKILTRESIETIDLSNGDMHRFITPILDKRGFKLDQIQVDHKHRKKGKSKYGFGRVIPVTVDGMMFYFSDGFSRPKKYAIAKLSFILFFLSLVINSFVLFQKLIQNVFVHRNPLFVIAMILLLLSIQIFSSTINE